MLCYAYSIVMETSPQVTVSVQGPLLRVSVGGRWNLDEPWPLEAMAALSQVADQRIREVRLESADLGQWDSTLLVFLVQMVKAARARELPVHTELPEGLERLIKLAFAVPAKAGSERSKTDAGFVTRVGESVLALPPKIADFLNFLGEIVLSIWRLFLGRAKMRPMLLQGKKALILGLANNRSIAYGIANALKEQGARLAFNYVGDAIKKRVDPLSEELGGEFTFQCDVCDDAQIQAAADLVKEKWGDLDILVHSVAFANREDLGGRFVDTSREGFRLAMTPNWLVDRSAFTKTFQLLEPSNKPLEQPRQVHTGLPRNLCCRMIFSTRSKINSYSSSRCTVTSISMPVTLPRPRSSVPVCSVALASILSYLALRVSRALSKAAQ